MQQFLRFCSNKIWHSIIAIVCLALARYYCNVVVLRVRAGLNKGAFYCCFVLSSVTFKDASGWRLTASEEITGANTIDIPESDLKDNGKVAKYLSLDYSIYYWDRVVR